MTTTSPKFRSGLPIHFVIPDTQVKPAVPTEHLSWIGKYISDHGRKYRDVTVVHLGDHWDMPSLSSYDRGKRAMEGRRYHEDVEAGNAAFTRLDAAIGRHADFKPRKVFLLGNHENRIERAAEDNAVLEGTVSLDDLDTKGWERVPYLQPVFINGVAYCHYFYNPMNGRAISGMIETRLKTIGRSFTQGHQQVLMYGVRPAWSDAGTPTLHHGLVAGAAYVHEEEYLGPQGNAHWRGIIVCHEVRDGTYDPLFVSLDYLARRYTGKPIADIYPWLSRGVS